MVVLRTERHEQTVHVTGNFWLEADEAGLNGARGVRDTWIKDFSPLASIVGSYM
jgi:hypothetical protein